MGQQGRPQNDWRKFCEIFINMGGTLSHANGFASAAAKQAGYGNPKVAACRLLKRVDVREYIDNLLKSSLAKGCETILSADEIMEKFTSIVKGEKNVFAQIKALENLAKYRGLYVEKVADVTPRHLLITNPDGSTAMDVHG
jgi:phage terminase small subunit